MKNKIKYCLFNDIGGPNVEQIIGLGMSIAVLCGLYWVAGRAYKWIVKVSKVVLFYK